MAKKDHILPKRYKYLAFLAKRTNMLIFSKPRQRYLPTQSLPLLPLIEPFPHFRPRMRSRDFFAREDSRVHFLCCFFLCSAAIRT